jgi:hypothetical protein
VDVADFRERQELALGPLAWLDPVPVDPVRSGRVAADLEILAQLLVADRAALGEQQLDLLEHERVAFDRCRVMRFLEPDASPDAFGLKRRGQPTESLAQLADL